MKRLRVIHWQAEGAQELAARLRAAGCRVDATPFDGPAALKRLRRAPPDAVVIDLSRLPSRGRDLALALREAKATRQVPLVFVGGEPAKVERIRTLLPDAVYTVPGRLRGSVRRVLARPPRPPVAPRTRMDGYAATPLPKKLGIGEGARVALRGAPPDFERTLGRLPPGVHLRRRLRGTFDLLLWFVRSRAELERGIGRMAARTPRGGLWIVWPKRASAARSDLGQADVRRAGLAAGLVDYKICSVDPVWSGLRFARRSRPAD